jgi:hypothetical protein
MGEVRIGSGTVGVLFLGILAAAGAAVAAQVPEIKRYLQMRQM